MSWCKKGKKKQRTRTPQKKNEFVPGGCWSHQCVYGRSGDSEPGAGGFCGGGLYRCGVGHVSHAEGRRVECVLRGRQPNFISRVIAGSRTNVTISLADIPTFAGANEIKVAAGSAKELLFWYNRQTLRWCWP